METEMRCPKCGEKFSDWEWYCNQTPESHRKELRYAAAVCGGVAIAALLVAETWLFVLPIGGAALLLFWRSESVTQE